jgi:hypothetical protein
MRKRKLAWWVLTHNSTDLFLSATGAEGLESETMGACIGYHKKDYVFYADVKDTSFKSYSFPTKYKKEQNLVRRG